MAARTKVLPILIIVLISTVQSAQPVDTRSRQIGRSLHEAAGGQINFQGVDPLSRRRIHVSRSENLSEVARQLYGEAGVACLRALKKLGPQFGELIYYPQVAAHSKSFFHWMEREGTTLLRAPALDVFARFRKRKGSRMVYRGVRVSPEQMIRIRDEGMLSALHRTPFAPHLTLDTKFSGVSLRELGLMGISSQHIYAQPGFVSPFVSVSAYPEMAARVAFELGVRGEGSRVFVVKARIPRVDILEASMGVTFIKKHPFADLKQLSFYGPSYDLLYEVPFDHRVEGFVLWGIAPQEIEEVYEGRQNPLVTVKNR